MSIIKTIFDIDKNLTVHEIAGKLSTSDIIDKLKDYYTGDKITKYVMWNFIKAEVSAITSSDLRKILYYTKEYAHSRLGGKSALVVSKDLGYGLARIFEAFVEIEKFPFELKTFRTLTEAREWLLPGVASFVVQGAE